MEKTARGCFAYTQNQQASEKTYKINSLANDKPESKKICEGFLVYTKAVAIYVFYSTSSFTFGPILLAFKQNFIHFDNFIPKQRSALDRFFATHKRS